MDFFTLFLEAIPQVNPNDVGVPQLDADTVLANGLSLVYFFTGAIASIVLIASGLLYVMSEGEPKKIQRAKNGIIYGIVGLLVVSFAFVITFFIVGRF